MRFDVCSTGNFSRLRVSLLLQREVGFFFMSKILPSLLVVMTSWTSFWLDTSAAAARVSLGVTTVLAMVTVNTGARELIPHVSYVKCIDVWLSVCMLFVFAAVLEYAYVNTALRRHNKLKRVELRQGQRPTGSGKLTKATNDELSSVVVPEDVTFIDLYSRVLFPLLFLLFNAMFWSYLVLTI